MLSVYASQHFEYLTTIEREYGIDLKGVSVRFCKIAGHKRRRCAYYSLTTFSRLPKMFRLVEISITLPNEAAKEEGDKHSESTVT